MFRSLAPLLAGLLLAAPLAAKTLNVASAFDPQTMDHAARVSVVQWPNDIVELRFVEIR